MFSAGSVADWLPYVVLAIAVATLAGLIARFVIMYRDMRREKAARKQEEPCVVLGVDGDYFVLSAMLQYGVGQGRQLAASSYLLKTADGNAVAVQINGAVRDCADGQVLVLSDGDILRCEQDVRIKPQKEEE